MEQIVPLGIYDVTVWLWDVIGIPGADGEGVTNVKTVIVVVRGLPTMGSGTVEKLAGVGSCRP